MHGGDKETKIKNNSDKACDEKSFCSQGACPKVMKQSLINEEKVCDEKNKFLNGSGFHDEKDYNTQNGAGCSFWLSSSSSSSSPSIINDILHSDINNGCSRKEKGEQKITSHEMDKVTSSQKKKENHEYCDNSSGNEGDEALSGDDCCIYTYKGDQFADLPNSFFPDHMAEHEGEQKPWENQSKNHNRGRNHQSDDERSNPGSSPDMDYLEMDFDPGPSLEHDSEEDDDNGLDKELENGSPVPDLPSEIMSSPARDSDKCKIGMCEIDRDPEAGPSNELMVKCPGVNNNVLNGCCSNNDIDRTRRFLDSYQMKHEASWENESCANCDFDIDEKLDLDDNRVKETQSFGGKRLDSKLLLTDNTESCATKRESDSDVNDVPFDGIMLWTEQEAISNQVTILSSDIFCGATAVINVMLVLKMQFSIENVKEGIYTRLKTDSSSIPQYLVSKSFAGVAHENLIRGIHHASYGTLYAKFFQMYPRRDIELSRWLSRWMKLGAVPIATMNVQRDSSLESPVGDSRHHQMVFGVGPKGIYLTNPMECLQDEELWSRLTSPSVLNIKRQEIVSRWSPDTNLKPLMFQSDDRWKTMNVLGQVVNVIRESPDPSAQWKTLTKHISIPASSGITLVIPRDSPGYEELVSTPELPVLSPSKR